MQRSTRTGINARQTVRAPLKRDADTNPVGAQLLGDSGLEANFGAAGKSNRAKVALQQKLVQARSVQGVWFNECPRYLVPTRVFKRRRMSPNALKKRPNKSLHASCY